MAPKIARLRENIELGDEDGVQQAVFELNPVFNGWKRVPDEVVEQLLTVLRDEKMYSSHLAAHVLNFFEFESRHLTSRQKSLCVGFLKAHGDQFTQPTDGIPRNALNGPPRDAGCGRVLVVEMASHCG